MSINRLEKQHVLPTAFSWVRLGDHVSRIGSGLTPRGGQEAYVRSGVPLIRSQNVHLNRFEPTGLAFITPAQDAEMIGSRVEANDVLLNITGASIGRVCVVPTAFCPANVNQHVCVIRTNRALDPDFLAFFLSSPAFQAHIWGSQAGATRQALTKGMIEDFSVPYGPLAEQRRIAVQLKEELAEVARARAAVEAQLKAAQLLPAALLREVFQSGAADKWPRSQLGTVCKVQSGYAFKSDWFSAEGIRLLRNINISQGHICWEETAKIDNSRRREFKDYELAVGDIVISLDRPVVSGGLKIARLTDQDIPALLLQRVGRLLIERDVIPEFLYLFLQTPEFITIISGHDQSLGVPHVSPKQIENVLIPLPTLDVQRSVADRLAAALESQTIAVKAIGEQLESINQLPNALLATAFSCGDATTLSPDGE